MLEQVRQMAATLLSNPVIEDFTVAVETVPTAVSVVDPAESRS